MMTELKTYSKSLLRKLPPVDNYLRNRAFRKRFSVELDLIAGRHRNEIQIPSILHFSLNKAATQYTKNILRRCASENGMVPVSLHDYAFHTSLPYLDQLSESELKRYQHIFKPTGYLYSVFGGMIESIPELEKYKIVFMIRDPRDILVSEYYSIAYSHVVPDQKGNKYEHFMQRRRTAQSSSIDDFVVADSERVYEILRRYKDLLIDRCPHAYLTKYEEMISDFNGWLHGLIEHCQLKVSTDLLNSLLEKNVRSQPTEENVQRHIRKGQAKDYQEKLKPETIRYLDSKFSPMLKVFRYTSD